MVMPDDSGGAFISGAPVERAPLGTSRLTGLAFAVRERWQKEVTGHPRETGRKPRNRASRRESPRAWPIRAPLARRPPAAGVHSAACCRPAPGRWSPAARSWPAQSALTPRILSRVLARPLPRPKGPMGVFAPCEYTRCWRRRENPNGTIEVRQCCRHHPATV